MAFNATLSPVPKKFVWVILPLILSLKNGVKDYVPVSQNPIDALFPVQTLQLSKIINAIENAKYDDKIKGISISGEGIDTLINITTNFNSKNGINFGSASTLTNLTDLTELAQRAELSGDDIRTDVIKRAQALLSDPNWPSDTDLEGLSEKLLSTDDFTD